MENVGLRQAIRATFEDRKTHELPVRVPLPSKEWSRPYLKLANEVGLEFGSLPAAGEALQQFLEPALVAEAHLSWNQTKWQWESIKDQR